MAQNYGSTDIYEAKACDLGDLCALLGGPHDSPAKRQKIMQHQQRAKDLLILTKSLFETISELKSNDEVTRLAVSKVKEEYDNIVPKHNEMNKMVVAKLSQLVNDARNAMSISASEREESIDNMESQLVKDDEELEAAEAFHERYLQLEKDLVMVENLYTDINKVVLENKEQVDKIEVNVNSAHDDVEKATEQLGNAVVYKRKAFKKKICIVVTVLIILTILGLIIGFSLKSNK